ncbi:MAG: HesA/MoeB/ThiF family protein [Polyangia bacterium]
MRVLLVGAGGLGSPVALALVRAREAALGRITLLDGDRVELSNLHRQLLHGERDLLRRKVDSGAERLRALGPGPSAPDVRPDIRPLAERLEPGNAAALLAEHDLVIEGSDQLETKFLVNDAALAAGVPAIIGGVVKWRGQVLTVMPRPRAAERPATACYRCLFEEPPPPGQVASCQQAGVLGPACGVVGGVMAAEALRLMRGEPPLHAGALVVLELLSWQARRVALRPRPGCPACDGASCAARPDSAIVAAPAPHGG